MKKSISDEEIIFKRLSGELNNKYDWHMLITKYQLTEKQLESCINYINVKSLAIYQELSYDFIKKHADELSWHTISMYQKMTDEILSTYEDELDWGIISQYNKLTDEQLKKYKNKVNWNNLYLYKRLTLKQQIKYFYHSSIVLVPLIFINIYIAVIYYLCCSIFKMIH